MNEFIFLSLKNVDDILTFSQVCKKGNEIYKKWKNEWYTIHTQIAEDVDGHGDKREIKIIGNRKYITSLYENGTTRYKIEYKNGKEEGKWILWYRNKNKKYEVEYKDGKKEKVIWYFDNGNKWFEEKYNDGKFDERLKRLYWAYKDGKLDEWIILER